MAKNTKPIAYTQQLQEEASDIASRIQTAGGDRIKNNGNMSFVLPDGTETEVMEGVILEFRATHSYYDRPYDPDNPSPPACYAVGQRPAEMVPHPDTPDPQAESCAVCPMNQFGSAQTGKGKACRNKRLIAFSPLSSDNPEDMDEEPPIWLMAVPPTSLKEFDAYVSTVSTKYGLPPVGVLTEVYLGQGQWFSPRFRALRQLSNEELGPFMEQRDVAIEQLETPPDWSQFNGEQEPASQPARRQAPAKKKAAAKKAAPKKAAAKKAATRRK